MQAYGPSMPCCICNASYTDEHEPSARTSFKLAALVTPFEVAILENPVALLTSTFLLFNQAAAIRIQHRAGIANFSFGIPLAALAGRGIDAGVGLVYNSRTWNKSLTEDPNNPNATIDHYTYDVEQSWIAPGFSSGLGHLNSYFLNRSVVMMNGSNTYIANYGEVVPDGITDADGTRHQIECKTWAPIVGGHVSARYCTAYETTDGSFIKVIYKGTRGINVTSSVYSQTNFTLIYPNGSKNYYSGAVGSGDNRKHYPLIIQDSNGNRIRIAYKADQSGRVDFHSQQHLCKFFQLSSPKLSHQTTGSSSTRTQSCIHAHLLCSLSFRSQEFLLLSSFFRNRTKS